jgi:hypothetical protein
VVDLGGGTGGVQAVLDRPEGGEVGDELGLVDLEVVVEDVQELLLHEVDLGEGEEAGVALPVHVLGARVVQVLGGADQDGQENAVARALHTVSHGRKALLQASQVN